VYILKRNTGLLSVGEILERREREREEGGRGGGGEGRGMREREEKGLR